MKRYSLRYTLLTCRFDQIWFPVIFWALFAFLVVISLGQPDQVMGMVRAYLGALIPLISGILAAYAVLDDPALELRFATPISAAQTLCERLGLIFAIQTVAALSFQGFVLLLGGDFSVFGPSWADVQLAWSVPTLALMALGVLGALAAAQPMAGALFIGLVWIVELIARGWLAQNAGKYVLIFMGALMADHPDLRANQWVLFLLTGAFFLAAWRLLQRQERYL